MSATEFAQDVNAAKRAAAHEPVIVTAHGQPTHVLLTISEYERLTLPAEQQAAPSVVRTPEE